MAVTQVALGCCAESYWSYEHNTNANFTECDCLLTLLFPTDSLFHFGLEPVVLDANLGILALNQPDAAAQSYAVMQLATKKQEP